MNESQPDLDRLSMSELRTLFRKQAGRSPDDRLQRADLILTLRDQRFAKRPAYESPYEPGAYDGAIATTIRRRDWFAAQALAALVQADGAKGFDPASRKEVLASDAVDLADALIDALRDKHPDREFDRDDAAGPASEPFPGPK